MKLMPVDHFAFQRIGYASLNEPSENQSEQYKWQMYQLREGMNVNQQNGQQPEPTNMSNWQQHK